jgi:hypothetical protein
MKLLSPAYWQAQVGIPLGRDRLTGRIPAKKAL